MCFSLHYGMILHDLTLAFAILILIYHQVTTTISIFPWNDTSKYTKKEIITEAGSNGLLMGFGVICLLLPDKGFFHFYPLFYYPFLFAGEIFQWWLPYFSDKFSKMRLGDDYEIRFARTTKIFKSRNGKHLPDANHTLLHALTVITLILVFVDRIHNR
jgi:hypothetical protein